MVWVFLLARVVLINAEGARNMSFFRDLRVTFHSLQTRQRFNEVVKTGSPGFIPQGR